MLITVLGNVISQGLWQLWLKMLFVPENVVLHRFPKLVLGDGEPDPNRVLSKTIDGIAQVTHSLWQLDPVGLDASLTSASE